MKARLAVLGLSLAVALGAVACSKNVALGVDPAADAAAPGPADAGADLPAADGGARDSGSDGDAH